LPVEVNHGSGEKHRLGGEVGEVVAAAGGKALVSWPAMFERDPLDAEIVDAIHLVVPGMVDDTGLSQHQAEVLAAAKAGDANFAMDADGKWFGRMNGRAINPRTLEILVERGLLDVETAEIALDRSMRL
jgi:predicted outer membrane protein